MTERGMIRARRVVECLTLCVYVIGLVDTMRPPRCAHVRLLLPRDRDSSGSHERGNTLMSHRMTNVRTPETQVRGWWAKSPFDIGVICALLCIMSLILFRNAGLGSQYERILSQHDRCNMVGVHFVAWGTYIYKPIASSKSSLMRSSAVCTMSASI